MSETKKPLAEVETIKDASNYLRGGIAQGLKDPITGAIASSDTNLIKFHGMYMQDDRDLRNERQKQKLEPLYSFMIRVRMPGGVCTPKQWLQLDEIARVHANGTLRLTTRQTFQFHGVFKRTLKKSIQDINKALLDTLAACGDVNRNVLSDTNPHLSSVHREVYEWAKRISEHLLPRTRAYHEIWIDDELVAGGEVKEDVEPLYGKHYLPRKFKTAVAIPPSNEVDVFANDLGFIAIIENGKLVGFNVTAGGGMGMTHGEKATYPRIADVLGFCTPDLTLEAAAAVLTTQRDHGDRTNRKHARLKYTMDDKGVEWFRDEVSRRMSKPLEKARPFTFTSNGDRYGWVQGENGRWHYTAFIMSGRIKDEPGRMHMTGLRKIAQIHDGEFRVTANQNVIIANVSQENLHRIAALLAQHNLDGPQRLGGLRLNAMACVAFPTCGLAMAESERYLPSLLDKLEQSLTEVGLREDAITIRMTGCPNGCARPFISEIGLVGKNLGKYNLYLGAGFHGQRLSKLYKENVGEEEILSTLAPLFARYAKERTAGEHFGDFVVRAGVVKATVNGKDFHE